MSFPKSNGRDRPPSPFWFVRYMTGGRKQYIGPFVSREAARDTQKQCFKWLECHDARVVWRLDMPQLHGRSVSPSYKRRRGGWFMPPQFARY